jgi:Ca2+-binding RTX toxin-like protein
MEKNRVKRIMLAMTLMALALALSAGVALAANVICAGGLCPGTPQDDTITGSSSADDIRAKGGDDRVDAGGSANGTADVVKGGPDDDTIDGEGGDDVLEGGTGQDELEDTTFDTPNDHDDLFGGKHRDVLIAVDGDSNDVLDGGDGANDICEGDVGDSFPACENITTF